jgi:hypothetical protein
MQTDPILNLLTMNAMAGDAAGAGSIIVAVPKFNAYLPRNELIASRNCFALAKFAGWRSLADIKNSTVCRLRARRDERPRECPGNFVLPFLHSHPSP